jgi:hypothetical protein
MTWLQRPQPPMSHQPKKLDATSSDASMDGQLNADYPHHFPDMLPATPSLMPTDSTPSNNSA